MKFVFVLAVAVLAVSATAFPSKEFSDFNGPVLIDNFDAKDGFLQALIKIIKDAIERAQKALQDIIAKLEDILHNINNTIQKIIDESRDLINGIANKAVGILEEIAKQDEISRKCVESNRPDLDVAIAEHSVEMQVCYDHAIEEAQNIRNDIEPHLEAIRDNIDALEDIVSECLETNGKIMGVVQCIINKTDSIKTEIGKLLINAKEALVAGPRRANEIIREARQCVKNSNTKFEQQIADIIKNVHQCINDSQTPQLLN